MRLKHPKTLITGRPGTGKTTFVRRVLEHLQPVNAVGFFTTEIRSRGKRLGFELRSLKGERRILAHVDIESAARVGKYGVDTDGFEEFLAGLDLSGTGVELVVIDEIGKMELLSRRFQNRIVDLLNSDTPLLATIALQGGGLIQGIKERENVFVVEITPHNRDRLLYEILEDTPTSSPCPGR
jgi:nucleoside-triphosphatase